MLIKTSILAVLTILLPLSTSFAQTKTLVTKISPTLIATGTDTVIKKLIESDLQLSASFIFLKTSPLHQKIFGNESYLAWFNKRIKRISVGSCMGSETAVACVIPLFSPDKMRVTQNFVEMNSPQIARMSVLFHEAKHTEYNAPEKEGDPDLRFWMHVKCPSPFVDEKNQERMSIWTGAPLAGVDGCDMVADGAYGTVVVMLKNISKYSTNTSEKLKADAEIYANDQQIRVTDAAAHEKLLKD
jgi:hypothetical protein